LAVPPPRSLDASAPAWSGPIDARRTQTRPSIAIAEKLIVGGEDPPAEVRAVTAGKGADVVFDLVSGRVYELATRAPIAGAMLDVWQAATNGLYENQDANQPDYNLRGRFETDKDGTFELVALLPTPYPVPTDGPVGELLRLAKRQPYRPAHIHFIVSAPNFETLVTQVFRNGDPILDDDPVFSADRNLIGEFRRDNGEYSLQYDFQLKRGVSTMPKAPIP
jgi:catechol 1,2-dioxygenase